MSAADKEAILAAKKAEMEKRMAEAAENVREQFAAYPYEGPEYTVSREELYLPMHDGVKLFTVIYKPAGLQQFPVLIQRSCYPTQMVIYELYGQELAKRGYGYVLEICRGTGKSEGTWVPNVNERPDGIDTLNWLNDQPWAESIGYFGASYLGLTGWAIADVVPDKVKGMMLTVYGTDRCKSAYEKGLFRHDVLTGWAMGNAGRTVDADYLESCLIRPHAGVDEALWGGRIDWYQDWIHATKPTDAYWQQGWWAQLRDIPAKTKVPVYIVEAWYDHHFGSAMNTYEALAPETRAHSWLDIGCWNHMSMPCVEWGEQHNLENGDVKRLLEWFDLILKKKQLPENRVRTYVMGEDRWQTVSSWPSVCANTVKLYPGQGSSLSRTPGAAGTAEFDYDPLDPCPTHGAESVLTTIREAGSLLQPEPGYRSDVLSFVSEPMQEPLPICGRMKVRLKVSTDGEDTAFSAKLCQVFPDGKAYNIRSGITSIAADLPEGKSYVPGEQTEVCIDFWDMVWTVAPGCRLRLDISSSDFPQYAVHSNFAGIWSDQAKTRVAHQTVFTGCSETCLELPVIK